MNKQFLLMALFTVGIVVPAWSQEVDQFGRPVVSTIVFSSTRDHTDLELPTALARSEIYRISLKTDEHGTPTPDTGTLTRLTLNEVGAHGLFGGNVFATLSPDGKKIVFDSNRDRTAAEPLNTSDLFLMKADGRNQERLTRGSSATWSPNGKYIAFHASASGATCPVPVPPPPLPGISGIPGCPIKIDPGAATWDSDIFILRVPDDEDDFIDAPINITNTPQYIEDDANWSPDGKQIVFTRHLVNDNPRNSTTAEVCILTLKTLNVACVTDNFQEERAPAWSPDGTRIAFMCRNPANNIFEICVMNADGTGKTQLTNNSVLDATPTWSPDGQWLVFASTRPILTQQQLWLMRADDGTDQTQIVVPLVVPDPSPCPPPGSASPSCAANWFPSWGQLWVGDIGQD